MGRRMLAVILAAVVALVGVLLVLLYARSADSRAVAGASPRTVFVSADTVPAGTSLREALRLELVRETKTAARSVPEGALTTVDEENASLLALTEIPPGQYLLASGFGETPTGTKNIQVPAGKLAVAVQLTDPARVGSFVTPGSYVTLFATYPTPVDATDDPGGAATVRDPHSTSVLLDNVQVIGVGDEPLAGPPGATSDDQGDGADTQDGSQTYLVTLAVTPEEATRLVHSVNRFTLYAGLQGSDVEVDTDLRADDLTIFEGAR